MRLIVLDSSAALEALAGRPVDTALSERLKSAGEIQAPHLIDVEVLNGLRRLVMRGDMNADRASDARLDFADLAITRYPHLPLIDRMWSLRENLAAHDAVFVALAESLGCPLITCDARMAHAPGLKADIELFAARVPGDRDLGKKLRDHPGRRRVRKRSG